MINHEHKFIFVHIPKNAGTSIENSLFPKENLILFPKTNKEIDISQKVLYGQDLESKRFLQHLTTQEIKLVLSHKKYKEKFLKTLSISDYFKFSFVRNPWDRAVSEWRWRKAADKELADANFPNFLKNFLPKRLNEDHFMPQHQYLYDNNGKCLVDFIGRFESIKHDFNHICNTIGITKPQLPHANKTSGNSHYSEHYTPFLRDLIADIYAKDLELFDYKFATPQRVVADKPVAPTKQKRKLLFLHVPKCAGSSMYHSPLIQRCDDIIHPILPSGAMAAISEKLLLDHFKFAFVRNPWDRFVSLYFYFFNMKPDHFAYKYDEPTVKRIQPYKSFEEFCLNFAEFNHGKFHFLNQSQWTHHNNECFVDFVGRYENLQEDFNIVCDKTGIPKHELPHKNKSKHGRYTEYYNDETRQIVAKMYAKDIKHFGYKFGE